mgnify:CR=1 FL=1
MFLAIKQRFHLEKIMLHYAIVFFVIALVAAIFGFGGIAAGAVEIAKIIFFIFIIIPSPAFKIIKLVFYAVFVRPISYTGKT